MAFKHRKNFLPTFLIALIFWLVWGGLVFFQPPANNLVIVLFFSLLFLALFLTLSLFFANSRRGAIGAFFFTLVLIFRYNHLGNLLNLFLLAGIFLSLELYLDKRQTTKL
jgi:hypothetical protein